MECMKENKKRFFRKGGDNHRVQRSFDNHMIMSSSSSNCCRAPAPSPSIGSIDTMSLASSGSGSVTPAHNHKLPLSVMSNPNLYSQSQSISQLSQQQINARIISLTSSPCPCPQMQQNLQNLQNLQNVMPQNNHNHSNAQVAQVQGQQIQQIQHQSQNHKGRNQLPNLSKVRGGPSTSTNSGSLDEAEINMNCHRRFMPAPRRARSAERFDGMRVSHGGTGELPTLPRQATDDILSRSYRSPQILRTLENIGPGPTTSNGINGIGGNNGTGSSSATCSGGTSGGNGSRRLPPSAVVKPTIESAVYPVPSPPPSYTTAINEARDPPPYHQAVAAAMKQPTSLRPQGKGVNNRYASSQHHQQYQSNSLTSTPTGSHHPQNGMRSVASTPIFANTDNGCSCHKCQIQRLRDSGCGTEYNDAVYMESQAFLMHEIMTDGMAFCSIM